MWAVGVAAPAVISAVGTTAPPECGWRLLNGCRRHWAEDSRAGPTFAHTKTSRRQYQESTADGRRRENSSSISVDEANLERGSSWEEVNGGRVTGWWTSMGTEGGRRDQDTSEEAAARKK